MVEMAKKEFVGYEYKEITVSSEKASFFIDCYEAFGWEVDDNVNPNDTVRIVNGHPYHRVTIQMKRNRKIMNKMELTRLQRNFEHCVREIEEQERSKTSLATMYSLIIGFLGTAFMAGSVFAVTAAPPHIVLCVILAIPAFVGWALPYFVYANVKRKQTEKVTPFIEAKYEEIYEICEKGSKLL